MGPGKGGVVEEDEATGAGRTSNKSNSNSAPVQGQTPALRRTRACARDAHSYAQNGQRDHHHHHQDQGRHPQDGIEYDDEDHQGFGFGGHDDDDADADVSDPIQLAPNFDDQCPPIPPSVTQEDEDEDEDDGGGDDDDDKYDDKDDDDEEKKTGESDPEAGAEAVVVEDALDEEEEDDDPPDGGADRVRPTIEPDIDAEADDEAGALVVQKSGNVNALVGAASAAAAPATTGRRGILHNTGVVAMLAMAQGGG